MDLINEAQIYETGSDDCGWFELFKLHCCFTAPKIPCIISHMVPLLVMITPHIIGVLQHVQTSLRVPNNLNPGPMRVDCMA